MQGGKGIEMPSDLEQSEPCPLDAEELRLLHAGPFPPSALEGRVIDALRRRGAFGLQRRWHRWIVLSATGVLLFVTGWASARLELGRFAHHARPRFALLLERGEEATGVGPAEESRQAKDYREWASRLSGSNHRVEGERLADIGKELVSRNENEIPWSLGPDGVRGYFLVSARDLQEAVEIARSCPHLKYGGRIEVRPIDTP
jgi:hypothetical protein